MSLTRPSQDSALLYRLEADDRSAFDDLYNYYEPRLRLFLYPFIKNDESLLDTIIQDVFVKLWLKRKDLAGIEFIEYYLQRMARNRYFDLLKLRGIQERHQSLYARLQPDQGNDTHETLQLKEYMGIARKGMEEMPERRRMIFCLNVLDGLSLDEIAVKTGLSKDVVKKQLYKAKVFLKDYIVKHGNLSPLIAWLLIGYLFF